MNNVTVYELIDGNPKATNIEKNYLIEKWTESVYQATGRIPKSYELILLADWLMEEILKDRRTNKVQLHEYPILSDSQLKTRQREVTMEADLVDVVHQKKIHNQSTRKKDAMNIDF